MALTSSHAKDSAYPVLAVNLVRCLESEPSAVISNNHNNDDSNLQEDWNLGIKYSTTGIFRQGCVIGFSRLRSREKNSDEYVGQVGFFFTNIQLHLTKYQIPRYLLTKHLLRKEPLPETSAFIIHPTNFGAFAPRTLLSTLQSQGLSRDDAIRHLDSVQLLPVHNLPSAVRAIGQVSASLQGIQSNPISHPVVLIVAGLDTLADGVIRASSPVKGAAVLSTTLRTLTRISRAHASFLSILLVNTNGLGSVQFDDQPPKNADDDRPSREDGIITSIFQPPDSSLLTNLLMRTLDHGIDIHLLLSDVRADTVAEVIKDRVGSGFSKWGIWSQA
ncbi:hypothetical protein N7495_007910 [Penicillium taxi]|uniref:uncharacterized protein n=1 Tax=Penicillium taxi TaxID=168475 RepID=UPI0025458B4E|nr:uncharacterized protein N7495_007910 [Penicillium taxi]KAJ5887869.1 hypothetical protein N7495_007910 [Penicillium taxi]